MDRKEWKKKVNFERRIKRKIIRDKLIIDKLRTIFDDVNKSMDSSTKDQLSRLDCERLNPCPMEKKVICFGGHHVHVEKRLGSFTIVCTCGLSSPLGEDIQNVVGIWNMMSFN